MEPDNTAQSGNNKLPQRSRTQNSAGSAFDSTEETGYEPGDNSLGSTTDNGEGVRAEYQEGQSRGLAFEAGKAYQKGLARSAGNLFGKTQAAIDRGFEAARRASRLKQEQQDEQDAEDDLDDEDADGAEQTPQELPQQQQNNQSEQRQEPQRNQQDNQRNSREAYEQKQNAEIGKRENNPTKSMANRSDSKQQSGGSSGAGSSGAEDTARRSSSSTPSAPRSQSTSAQAPSASAAGAGGKAAAPGAGAGKGSGGGKNGGVSARAAIDDIKNKVEEQGGGVADKALSTVNKAEELVDTTASGLLVLVYILLAAILFIGSFPLLFVTGITAAPVALFPIISPKYAYKLVVYILYLIGVGEFVDEIVDADKIRITSLGKFALGATALTILVAWLALMTLMIGSFTYGVCKVSGASSSATGAVVGVYDTIAGTNYSTFTGFCQSFTSAVEGLVGGSGTTSGSSNYSSGSPAGSVKEYAGLIDTAAKANNIEYCALEALVLKESGGKSNIYSSKDGALRYVDASNADKKTFGLSFTDGYGHGIGLIQIFIYSKPRADAIWQDASTPSRKGDGFGKPGGWLTVADLIDPATNLNAGTVFWASLIRKNNGDLKEAYRDYQGASSAQVTLDKLYSYYQECKSRQ